MAAAIVAGEAETALRVAASKTQEGAVGERVHHHQMQRAACGSLSDTCRKRVGGRRRGSRQTRQRTMIHSLAIGLCSETIAALAAMREASVAVATAAILAPTTRWRQQATAAQSEHMLTHGAYRYGQACSRCEVAVLLANRLSRRIAAQQQHSSAHPPAQPSTCLYNSAQCRYECTPAGCSACLPPLLISPPCFVAHSPRCFCCR